jgi:hypothetical protein
MRELGVRVWGVGCRGNKREYGGVKKILYLLPPHSTPYTPHLNLLNLAQA